MTIEQTPHSEVWTLFEAACNGTIDTEQAEQLDAILHEDEQTCDAYLLYMRMHAQLFRTFCLERCRDKVLQSIQAPHSTASPAISDEENKRHAGSDSEIMPPPAFGVFSHILHGTVGFFSQEIPFSLLIATVITALGLLAGSLVYVTHHQQLAHDASRSSGVFPSHTTVPSDLKYVGRVTGMADVQWADINTSTEKGNGVPLGRKYAIASGLMEITYDTGATVILQGPVTYEVDSHDGGFLSIGKLTARLEKRGEGRGESKRSGIMGQQTVASGQWSVASEINPEIPKSPTSSPQPALTLTLSQRERGPDTNPQSLIPNPSLSTIHYPLFTIKTPIATVTDLGTEFGVAVNGEGNTETEVFVGEVSVALADMQNKGSNGATVVRQGHIAHVDRNAIRLSVPKHHGSGNSGFVRVMPLSTDSRQTVSDAYAALILSLQPAAYYRMERPIHHKDQLVVLDSAAQNRHGTIHLGTNTGMLWLNGRFGSALHLRGIMVGDYAVIAEYPQSQNSQLTVAAWVYAESRSSWATIAKNWGNGMLGQFHFGLSEDGEDLHVFLCEADGTRIELREGPACPLPINVWQHVALIVDRTRARLYRNGKEVGAVPCRGLVYPSPVRKLAIGCKLSDDGVTPDPVNPGYWRGRIDELVIFHHALPPAAIQKLYLFPSTEKKTNRGNKATD